MEDYSFRWSLQPHIDTVLEGGISEGPEFYDKFGYVYFELGRWNKAEELQLQARDVCLKVLGEEHPDTLWAMGNLAVIYKDSGRWTEAEELELQVRDVRLKVLGEEHLDTLSAMGNLAVTYRNTGRWKEAEELQLQVRDVLLRCLGKNLQILCWPWGTSQ